jgi:hypothetical protein
MSKMDFVVNFENVGLTQTPSKLIDYAILQKPILSIKTGGFQPEVVTEFLRADYTHALTIENPTNIELRTSRAVFWNSSDKP